MGVAVGPTGVGRNDWVGVGGRVAWGAGVRTTVGCGVDVRTITVLSPGITSIGGLVN